jgi:hypothetical protein
MVVAFGRLLATERRAGKSNEHIPRCAQMAQISRIRSGWPEDRGGRHMHVHPLATTAVPLVSTACEAAAPFGAPA